MLLAIISAILAYRKAQDSGRNGWLWALIAAATFIGTQFLVVIVLGLGVGVIMGATGQEESDFTAAEIIIRILAVIVSFGSTWLVLRYLDKTPEPDVYVAPPAPPDNFN